MNPSTAFKFCGLLVLVSRVAAYNYDYHHASYPSPDLGYMQPSETYFDISSYGHDNDFYSKALMQAAYTAPTYNHQAPCKYNSKSYSSPHPYASSGYSAPKNYYEEKKYSPPSYVAAHATAFNPHYSHGDKNNYESHHSSAAYHPPTSVYAPKPQVYSHPKPYNSYGYAIPKQQPIDTTLQLLLATQLLALQNSLTTTDPMATTMTPTTTPQPTTTTPMPTTTTTMAPLPLPMA